MAEQRRAEELVANEETGVQVNTKSTKCMVTSRDQNERQVIA